MKREDWEVMSAAENAEAAALQVSIAEAVVRLVSTGTGIPHDRVAQWTILAALLPAHKRPPVLSAAIRIIEKCVEAGSLENVPLDELQTYLDALTRAIVLTEHAGMA